MPCSEAQLAANRQNSLKSTGPRTPEGKLKCRANGLKHGLCSSEVIAEDLEAVEARELAWYYSLKPQNPVQGWLVTKIAVYSVRVDRCERIERRLRERKSLLAEVAWEDDHRFEAEVLGGKIRHKPAQVAEELRRTPAGCDWLISRWTMLANYRETASEWTPDQVALAFDLLGTPLEFREGRTPAPIDGQLALAAREIAAILEKRESVEHIDEVDRALTEADLFDEAHPELKRLRRYESAIFSKLRWFMSQFKYESPHLRPHPDLHPSRNVEPVAKPESKPEAQAAPSPAPKIAASAETKEKEKRKEWPEPFRFWMVKPQHPPFCLEPHEIPADGSPPDIKQIAVNRELKRQRKAEARYQARRRKLERLRA